MNDQMKEQTLQQLNTIFVDMQGFCTDDRFDGLSGEDQSRAFELITRARAAIVRISGESSEYFKQFLQAIDMGPTTISRILKVKGVILSLHNDFEKGYLETSFELVRSEIFSDFLEMASHLLEEGYKDAAALIASGALEEHLRQLCKKSGITLEMEGDKGIHPKKAETLNSDLAGKGAITKVDQKNVTAWLALRNKAAHAEYDEYSREQVALFIDSIRDFITRKPA
jgi:hypothetical protein